MKDIERAKTFRFIDSSYDEKKEALKSTFLDCNNVDDKRYPFQMRIFFNRNPLFRCEIEYEQQKKKSIIMALEIIFYIYAQESLLLRGKHILVSFNLFP